MVKNLHPLLLYYFLKLLLHNPLFSINIPKNDLDIYQIIFYSLKLTKSIKKNARGAEKQKKCPETVFRVPETVF
jgi:hypothetical protein